MQNTAVFLTGIVLFILEGLNSANSARCLVKYGKCADNTACCKGFACVRGECHKIAAVDGLCDYDYEKPCPKGYRCSKKKCTNEPCRWNGGECTNHHGCCGTKEFCKHGRCEGSCIKLGTFKEGGVTPRDNVCATLTKSGTLGCCVGWECREVKPLGIGGFSGTCKKIKNCNRTKEECTTGKCCDGKDECKSNGKTKVCTTVYGTEEDGFYRWLHPFYRGF